MNTKITIICENNAPLSSSNLIGEHGLSLLIESDDATLFDTGQGLGIINNMSHLKKDIGSIRRIILSHGHYDHTGGLLPVLKNAGRKISVYMHPAALNGKYAHDSNGNTFIEKNIGMSYSRDIYENAGAKFYYITGFYSITNQISSISEVKRPAGWKSLDPSLKHKAGERTEDDPFLDDLSLLINTDSGPVVLLGCAHSGIAEILDDISLNTGIREFYAVIGGTHLANAPQEYIEKTVRKLKEFRVKIIAPAHCSGFKIKCLLASEFKQEFREVSVGSIFEF